ncbi:hypothetical protein HDU96_010847 [Phlyctochytrium bullatum]|nr:hypothetical protein HDU96_010847 [Phlyctochytrium bullatum]
MTVSSIYTFQTVIDASQIKNQVLDFARHSDCCHRILVRGTPFVGRNAWKEVPLDIDNHFRIVRLPSPGTKAQLAEAIGKEVSAKFDFSKPLWDTVFYEGLQDGGSVLFLKAHHCIADGQGFVRNLLSYVAAIDPSKDKASLQYSAGRNMLATPPATPPRSPATPVVEAKSPDPAACPAASAAAAAAPAVAKKPRAAPLAPLMAIFLSLHFFLLYIVNFLSFLLSTKRSFSRPGRTAQKQVGWASDVSLEDVKEVKNALGVTVNDVLTACLGAAIEKYLADRGEMKDRGGFWFFIPTSLRRPDDWSVSNKTSGYILNVPLAKDDLVGAIRRFNKGMQTKKGSPEPLINFWSIHAGYLFPDFVPKIAKTVGFNRIHAVVTNVPGPSTPLPWAGEPIQEIVSFIPQAYANSLGCTIYTYRGKVAVSVMLDRDDSDRLFWGGAAQVIADGFAEVFGEVLEKVRRGEVPVGGKVKTA